MSFFTRMRVQKTADERGYDGSWTQPGKGAPPPHLRDKNKSHSAQGANGSIPTQEGALAQQQQQADGDETAYQRVDVLDTTNQ